MGACSRLFGKNKQGGFEIFQPAAQKQAILQRQQHKSVRVCLPSKKKKSTTKKKKNGRKVRWFEFVAGQPFSEGNFDLCPKVILITFQKWKELVQLKTQQIEEIGLKAGVVKNKKKKRKPQTNQREEEQRKERKEQEEATRDGRETKGEIGRICWAACRRQS